MTWSYDIEVSTPKDEVRLLIGDTDDGSHQLENEEITYLLALAGGSATGAGILAAQRLAAKYTRMVDKAVGDLKISYSQRAEGYRELRAELVKVSGSATLPIAYAGGTSIDRRMQEEDDLDRVDPVFKIGADDFAPANDVLKHAREDDWV